MYKNIIFDLYGTLIDLKTAETKDEFWHTMSLFFSYNGARCESTELKHDYNKLVKLSLSQNKSTKYPDTKVASILERLYRQKGITAGEELLEQTLKLFRAASTEQIDLYPGVKEMLETLKFRGKRLYILSNGQKQFSVPELKYLGIYDYFSGIYSSAENGVCKPDKAFFDSLIVSENLDRDECLFVGNDDICDVKGAKGAMLDCVYIRSNESRKTAITGADYEILDGDVLKILDFAK